MPFVPKDFEIPAMLETSSFRLRMLTVNDVVKDYDAVMSSLEHLQSKPVFGDSWPRSTLTLEQDLIDLGWHQKEFQTRRSFAYTMMSLDETQCLGCVYIIPSKNPEVDCEVYLWVRASEVPKGTDNVLFSTVKKWIAERWPFATVEYPFRQ
jgi:hypothetical protein